MLSANAINAFWDWFAIITTAIALGLVLRKHAFKYHKRRENDK